MNKVFLKTYGCQMNVADSERIKTALLRDGYQETENPEEANLIILNTCAVRKRAEDRALARLNSLKYHKRENPKLIIGLFGCIPTLYGEKLLEQFSYLDILCGPNSIGRIDSLLDEAKKGKKAVALKEEDGFLNDRCILAGKKKEAFLPIMKGCDNYCSYCVVPYTRGRERSKPSSQIMEEIKNLTKQGVKEITLLGQNVNSYGKGLSERINFAGLLKLADGIEGLERIKFMTSHPKDISQSLLEIIASCKKVEKQLHLPVQSGSDFILERMNRDYCVADYKRIVKNARELIPEISISTDIIVGFPGEKEKDFQQTLELLAEIRFDFIYAFKYSDRPKTAASHFEGQVQQKEKERRLQEVFKAYKLTQAIRPATTDY